MDQSDSGRDDSTPPLSSEYANPESQVQPGTPHIDDIDDFALDDSPTQALPKAIESIDLTDMDSEDEDAMSVDREEAMSDAEDDSFTSILVVTEEIIVHGLSSAPHLAFKTPREPLKQRSSYWRKSKLQHPLLDEIPATGCVNDKIRQLFDSSGNRASDPLLFRVPRAVAYAQRGEAVDYVDANSPRGLVFDTSAMAELETLSDHYGVATAVERVLPAPLWLLQNWDANWPTNDVGPFQPWIRLQFGRAPADEGNSVPVQYYDAGHSISMPVGVIDVNISEYCELRESANSYAAQNGLDLLPEAHVMAYEMGRALAAVHSAGLSGQSLEFIIAAPSMVPDRKRELPSPITRSSAMRSRAHYTYPVLPKVQALARRGFQVSEDDLHPAFTFGTRCPAPTTRRGQYATETWDPRCPDVPIEPKGWACWLLGLQHSQKLSSSNHWNNWDLEKQYKDAFFKHVDGSVNYTYPRIRNEPRHGQAGDFIRFKRSEHGGLQGRCADYFEAGYCDGSQKVDPHLSEYFNLIKDEQARRDRLEQMKMPPSKFVSRTYSQVVSKAAMPPPPPPLPAQLPPRNQRISELDSIDEEEQGGVKLPDLASWKKFVPNTKTSALTASLQAQHPRKVDQLRSEAKPNYDPFAKSRDEMTRKRQEYMAKKQRGETQTQEDEEPVRKKKRTSDELSKTPEANKDAAMSTTAQSNAMEALQIVESYLAEEKKEEKREKTVFEEFEEAELRQAMANSLADMGGDTVMEEASAPATSPITKHGGNETIKAQLPSEEETQYEYTMLKFLVDEVQDWPAGQRRRVQSVPVVESAIWYVGGEGSREKAGIPLNGTFVRRTLKGLETAIEDVKRTASSAEQVKGCKTM